MSPKELKVDREFLGDGSVPYKLRDVEMGELGHILLQPTHQGDCNAYEMIYLTDGHFEERKAILPPSIP